MGRGFVLAAVGLALGATGASASSGDVWKTLHRSLHMPKVASGAECPVSKVERRFNFAKYGVAEGIGRGPAYPMRTGLVVFDWPPSTHSEFAGSKWSGAKVLWFVSPHYRGPVLIRGRRLGRPEVVRFDKGKVPSSELRIPAGSSIVGNPGVPDVGQRYRPSYTRLRAPGCYAYQVDGASFSYAVVFRAERST
jgi:hypothetical protein